MGIRDWLAIIVIVFIVLILLDGFRRKWLERKNRIRVKLDKNIPPADGEDDNDVLVKSELPNGGARIKTRNGQEVPVLMDSVQLDDEDIAEYPADKTQPVAAASVDDDEDWDDWDEEEANEDDEESSEAMSSETDWQDEWEDEADDEVPASAPAAFSARDDDPEDDDGEDYSDVDDDKVEAGIVADDDDDWSDDDFADDSDDPDELDDLDDQEDEYDQVEPEELEELEEPQEPVARKGRSGSADERIEPTFGDDVLTFGRDDQGELDLEHHDLFDHEEEDDADNADDQDQAEEVIIINVMARPGTVIEGRRMLPILMKHGMRLGDMSIFHRHADNSGKGPVMFSMANMLRPGTFSISEMETFTTPGVSFFMQLPNKLGNMQCFEQMLKTAQAVKEELDANLKDENRSVFTRQTIEHSRQRIRDFELEMLARK